MTRRTLLNTTGGVLACGVLFLATPSYAALPVINPVEDGFISALQSALSTAINNIGKSITGALTDMTNPNSVSSLLTAGFTQMANYSKAQVGAQQQIQDASNTVMAQYAMQQRNAVIRDEQMATPTQCAALDNGQVIEAAALQGGLTAKSIELVTDARGEGVNGTPAYLGAGQAMQANNNNHMQRYCSSVEADAGLCTVSVTPAADQQASSLFGTDNLVDVNGVNVANDFVTTLLQPIVPATIRGDALKSINGQEAEVRRRAYNARMSMARSALNMAIGVEVPGVTLTSLQQAFLQSQGKTVPPNGGSWMQAVGIEVERRFADADWAAGIAKMAPASVEREMATEMALNNYIAFENLRLQVLQASMAATQLAAQQEATMKPTVEAPVPSITASN